MTERVDVAVVGGGIIGLACALHLRRMGAGRVVVLERDGACGLGSSSRANGGVRAQFTTPANIAFSAYSIAEFERMARELPDVLDFHQVGYLLFTGDREKVPSLETAVELQHSLGVATRWLDAGEVGTLAPIVSADGIVAATFHDRDGFLDPWSAVVAMGREAAAAGAEVCCGREVLSIESRPSGYSLTTQIESYEAGAVVDAAGAAAASVAAMIGAHLPVVPVRRNLGFIPDVRRPLIPMCVDLDSALLVRREPGGGYVIAFSDPSDPPGDDVSLDPKFLDDVAERIGGRFPHLEAMPIDPGRCWAGLYPETPDHHAVIGEVPGRPGFLVCAGFGGHGIMHAPAAGRAIAELLVDGACSTFDLRALRAERFAEGDLVQEAAVF
jgi:sarcosine oxidase subunit beta